MRDDEQIHPETVEDWADWLEANHDSSEGVWLVSWRTRTGRPRVPYEKAVVEALRFGWIDSQVKQLDENRTMQRFTPRRPGSNWARSNKERIERIVREGRLEEAGRRAVETAKADGSWTRLDAVENLEVPEDLEAAFDRHTGARERWDAFPPSARRTILGWIVMAKRPETRARRVEEAARRAARGERANQ